MTMDWTTAVTQHGGWAVLAALAIYLVYKIQEERIRDQKLHETERLESKNERLADHRQYQERIEEVALQARDDKTELIQVVRDNTVAMVKMSMIIERAMGGEAGNSSRRRRTKVDSPSPTTTTTTSTPRRRTA